MRQKEIYTSAKVFADMAEESAIEQIKNACDHPVFKGCKVRIMPDVHTGVGCVIGLTSPMPEGGEIIKSIHNFKA